MTHKNDGFTLVEVLVALNIAFIGLAIIVGAYLVISKTVSVSIKNSEKNNNAMELLYNIKNTLDKSEKFDVSFSADSIKIKCFNGKSIKLWKTGLMMDTIFYISDLKEVKVRITTIDSNIFQLPEDQSKLPNLEYNSEDGYFLLASASISGISIDIQPDTKKYSFTYKMPDISVMRFHNIE